MKTPELSINPEQQPLAAEIQADAQLAELAAVVDEAYSGFEGELAQMSSVKHLGSGDGLGYERRSGY